MEKFVSILILLLANLALTPHIVKEDYFDNTYFSSIYLLCGFSGVCVPFVFTTINRVISWISLLLGAWYMAGLTYEIINFFEPIYTGNTEKLVYVRYLIMFITGVSLIITHNSWKKQKTY